MALILSFAGDDRTAGALAGLASVFLGAIVSILAVAPIFLGWIRAFACFGIAGAGFVALVHGFADGRF